MATFSDPLGKRKNSEADLKRRTVDLQPTPGDLDSRPAPDQGSVEKMLYRFPWWAAFLIVLWIFIAFSIAADSTYSNIFRQLRAGIEMTLSVSFFAYSGAVIVGLLVGITRSNMPQPQRGASKRALSILHLIGYNVATLFLEIVRGLPILTILLMFAFVIVPEVKNYA